MVRADEENKLAKEENDQEIDSEEVEGKKGDRFNLK
jgi:hypothetical protein